MAISDVLQTVWHPILLRALDEMFADYSGEGFQLRLWDGTTWSKTGNSRFTLVLNNPEALRRLFVDPSELGVGEAYIAGDFEVEGDMDAAFELGDYLLGGTKVSGISELLLSVLDKMPSHERRATDWRRADLNGPVHSKNRDLEAIRYHYDLPPEFFALWLDRRMMYSSAYFADGDTDLDGAQKSELDYICKKLRLRPSENLLDIGCGWGGLIVYAAAQYGVRAHGVTLSLRQAQIARERIHDADLDNQCRVEVCDYRDIQSAQQFDKIVSIGMFEHVGQGLLPEYFRHVWQLLRPGGAFLNSGIASSLSDRRRSAFIDRYVFPDGELVPLNKSLGVAEATGFEVRDVEGLREHYAMTLHQWVRRLEACSQKARDITDETTYRIWRLYMAGSEHRFRSGSLNLYQMLLAKPRQGDSGMPLTRADWYS
jgi:cyclopropane-fatty-acyl-phospholipid synthase